MPSNYMPDVKVEIAFNAGYTTPAASRTWTDVSQWVELADGIGIDHGRQDERSTADANSLTLTLDNTDGRFTAQRAASPYYPNVKIGRPIRVTATPPGGTASTRFVGFIDEWPVEWDGTDSYAMARIRATSRLARLGLSARLRSTVENEGHSTAGLGAYWTLADPQDSTQIVDCSGANVAPLRATEGTPIGWEPSTAHLGDAAVFSAGSQYLAADVPLFVASGAAAIGAFFTATVSQDATMVDIRSVNLAGQPQIAIGMILGGTVYAAVETDGGAFDFVQSVETYLDGNVHHLAAVFAAGAGVKLYVDGVLVGTSGSLFAGGTLTASVVSVGASHLATRQFSGTLSHVVAFTSAPSAARVAAIAGAGLSGHAGERTDQRLLRILGWAGVATSEITTETGAETMTYQQTSGQSAVDALRDVESTEGGVLFDGRDGLVTFHNRSRRYLATVAATFDAAAQHVGSDYAPKLDRTTLTNDATVENPTTGETARSVDMASVDEYGVATASAKSVASTYDPLQQKAAWLVYSYAEPRPRVPSLTVDVLAHQGLTPSAQTILGLDVGALVAVTNQPTQADATSAQYFVEGYTESIGPESYQITYNLSPSHPSLNTFVIGDSVRGALDSSYVLGL
jgi:hypothetical protein